MKIKKLEWDTDIFGRLQASGISRCCCYVISHKLVPSICSCDGEYPLPTCDSLESAKAACQKHFEEEVMEYLENGSLNSEVPMPLLVQET